MAGIGLLMQVGAVCLASTVIAHDGDGVTLEFGPWATIAEIQGKAHQLCGEHGKIASLGQQTNAESGFRVAAFDCEVPGS
jgi:hypothetical protein